MSRERVSTWLRGHYLLNVFKASVAIILKILSLLNVVLRFLDDKLILILSSLTLRRSPPPQMFLGEGAQKICSKFQNNFS